MEYSTCDKCKISYNKMAGHQCDNASYYNEEDEFQASAVPKTVKDLFDKNSDMCIW